MAEECAAESWDCFPKFLAASLAACQSWYLCLIVITPPQADHYLAACLHFPSHFQKEIIKSPMLHREVYRCGSWLPPSESPPAGVSLPKGSFILTSQGKRAHCDGYLFFTQHLISSSKSEIWVSFSSSKDNSLPTFFLPNPTPPTHFLSLTPVSSQFDILTTTSLFPARH